MTSNDLDSAAGRVDLDRTAWLAAVEHAGLPAPVATVAEALAARADDDGVFTPAPTVPELVEVTGCDRLAVRRALRHLIAAGRLAAGPATPLRLVTPSP